MTQRTLVAKGDNTRLTLTDPWLVREHGKNALVVQHKGEARSFARYLTPTVVRAKQRKRLGIECAHLNTTTQFDPRGASVIGEANKNLRANTPLMRREAVSCFSSARQNNEPPIGSTIVAVTWHAQLENAQRRRDDLTAARTEWGGRQRRNSLFCLDAGSNEPGATPRSTLFSRFFRTAFAQRVSESRRGIISSG